MTLSILFYVMLWLPLLPVLYINILVFRMAKRETMILSWELKVDSICNMLSTIHHLFFIGIVKFASPASVNLDEWYCLVSKIINSFDVKCIRKKLLKRCQPLQLPAVLYPTCLALALPHGSCMKATKRLTKVLQLRSLLQPSPHFKQESTAGLNNPSLMQLSSIPRRTRLDAHLHTLNISFKRLGLAFQVIVIAYRTRKNANIHQE